MNLKKFSLFAIIFLFLAGSEVALAQPKVFNAPADGQMIRLDSRSFWAPVSLNPAEVTESRAVASDLHYPSISPDGTRILMFNPGKSGEPNQLHLWSKSHNKVELVQKDREISPFISWQDDQTYQIRERSKPFFKDGGHRVYDFSTNRMRGLKRIKESPLVVYYSDDMIILENARNRTLQVISDSAVDRFFAPTLSPDQRYVAYMGLSTGVYVFDVAQNAVVYVGRGGKNPFFSPDGRYMVYARTADNGHEHTQGDLILVDLDRHTVRLISNPHAEIRLRASLSAGARQIAYETDDGRIITGNLNIPK